MDLVIISPRETLDIKNVDKVALPGAKGGFMVLQGHAPLVSLLKKGVIVYTQKDDEKQVQIEGGVVEVSNDMVKVLIEQ